jgi:hypothetical protein
VAEEHVVEGEVGQAALPDVHLDAAQRRLGLVAATHAVEGGLEVLGVGAAVVSDGAGVGLS